MANTCERKEINSLFRLRSDFVASMLLLNVSDDFARLLIIRIWWIPGSKMASIFRTSSYIHIRGFIFGVCEEEQNGVNY